PQRRAAAARRRTTAVRRAAGGGSAAGACSVSGDVLPCVGIRPRVKQLPPLSLSLSSTLCQFLSVSCVWMWGGSPLLFSFVSCSHPCCCFCTHNNNKQRKNCRTPRRCLLRIGCAGATQSVLSEAWRVAASAVCTTTVLDSR
ncbi:hypothetical protein DQ04_08111040, partial [Trypanosoma grayi]|uniref:hypothetical protein n=1 Tax=Trypanosoma grayi TaxID=71804 RepID=UPI0004F46C17